MILRPAAGHLNDRQRAITVRRAELHAERESCLAIRLAVFVGEQNVPLQEEVDGIDDECVHYLAFTDGRAVGTARVIPRPPVAKIGRVAVVPEARGQGLGLLLMRYVIADAARSSFTEAMLDSQTYAIPFYERLGFVAEGDEFLDANIPHFRMRRPLVAEDAGI